MKHKCINCIWEGNELSDKPIKDKCPVCGDEVSGLATPIQKQDTKPSKSILSRIKDVTEDLLDDGKLNHSNNPTKKSPGRKKSKRGNK